MEKRKSKRSLLRRSSKAPQPIWHTQQPTISEDVAQAYAQQVRTMKADLRAAVTEQMRLEGLLLATNERQQSQDAALQRHVTALQEALAKPIPVLPQLRLHAEALAQLLATAAAVGSDSTASESESDSDTADLSDVEVEGAKQPPMRNASEPQADLPYAAVPARNLSDPSVTAAQRRKSADSMGSPDVPRLQLQREPTPSGQVSFVAEGPSRRPAPQPKRQRPLSVHARPPLVPRRPATPPPPPGLPRRSSATAVEDPSRPPPPPGAPSPPPRALQRRSSGNNVAAVAPPCPPPPPSPASPSSSRAAAKLLDPSAAHVMLRAQQQAEEGGLVHPALLAHLRRAGAGGVRNTTAVARGSPRARQPPPPTLERSNSEPLLPSWDMPRRAPSYEHGLSPDDLAATALRRERSGTLVALPEKVAERQLSSRRPSRQTSSRALTSEAVASARSDGGRLLFSSDEAGARPLVLAGRADDLLAWATREEELSNEDFDTLLMVHGRYLDASAVLNCLVAPLRKAPAQREQAELTRLSRLMCFWMRGYPCHFDRSGPLFVAFVACLQADVAPRSATAAEYLLQLLNSVLLKHEATARLPPPRLPPLPPSQVSSELLDLSPKSLARALTMVQCKILRCFPAEALASGSWEDKEGVKAAVERFNRVSMWAAGEVVATPNLKKRASVLAHLTQVAHECRKLGNFATAMQLVAGLSMACVTRLKRAWKLVPKRSAARLARLRAELEPLANFREYRAALAQAALPVLPYMGLYMRDATFVEDGNDDYLENGMANMEKLRMLGAIVREVRYFQLSSYAGDVPTATRAYVAALPAVPDEDALYALSYTCEPPARTL